MSKTAVLLLLFNRPNFTRKLIAEVKKYSPTRVYIHCDGPREGNYFDKKKCLEVKKIIKKMVNWKCKKKIIYQKKNLGLRDAIINGIDFFFRNEKKGIILEDSMLPSQSFFLFCNKLLKKYNHDEKISLISGWNPISNYQINESYTFSELPKIWGWATWKRSWLFFDREMKSWPQNKKKQWMRYGLKKPFFFRFYWEKIFQDTYTKKTNTWDYNLVYSNWLNNKICIIPKYNLIENQDNYKNEITTHKNNFIGHVKKNKLTFPLVHPLKLEVNKSYDCIYYNKFYNFKIFFFNIQFARIIKKFFNYCFSIFSK